LFGAGLRGLIALFLRHLLVLCGAVFGAARAFLRRAFVPQRFVAGEIAGGFLASAEQFVEKAHVPSS
jgi:hypothetical protein